MRTYGSLTYITPVAGGLRYMTQKMVPCTHALICLANKAKEGAADLRVAAAAS